MIAMYKSKAIETPRESQVSKWISDFSNTLSMASSNPLASIIFRSKTPKGMVHRFMQFYDDMENQEHTDAIFDLDVRISKMFSQYRSIEGIFDCFHGYRNGWEVILDNFSSYFKRTNLYHINSTEVADLIANECNGYGLGRSIGNIQKLL